MHASIWRFNGDPDDLLPRYDAVAAAIPASSMRLHLCLRAPDGILLVDTCPTAEQVDDLIADASFRDVLAAHGLPAPERVDAVAVHAAYVDGREVSRVTAAASR